MSLFTKILKKEIPATIIYEDALCFAIRDISPQAPVHVLLIPKKEIESLAQLNDTDRELMGHMMLTVPLIAKQEGIAERGFRTVINTGSHAGMTVPHIHIHILGGRALSWPPG
jgi:histidine triad (HIT) family protein